MNIGYALLIGTAMLAGSLIVVELTASAVQMAAVHAESTRIATRAAEERQFERAAAPVRDRDVLAAALH
jgi:hypothetical protein